MFFRIDKKIINTAPGVYTGVVTASGLDNKTENAKVSELLQAEIAKTSEKLAGEKVRDLESLSPYRAAMQELGVNPSKYMCSIESILTRIVKQGSFPTISPVVDLGNYISIKYQVPVGVHDVDTITEDLYVRTATQADCENSENSLSGDQLVEGEPVYACGSSVRTRRWLWRQMPAGKVTADSCNFIFPIDGFESNKEVVMAAVTELADLIQACFGQEAKTGAIDASCNEFQFGQLTAEEQLLEEQIAIMLKGVDRHTTVPEIREKMLQAKKENRPLRIKLGLDPSAPDIHIGHSVVLRKIRQLQEMGHVAVIIIGDYTGMIGDPTGKSKTRKQLTREDVERNANTYMEQIFKIVDRDKTEVYYNSEWLSKMNFADVIDLAAKCTVARMLERDDFNNRYTNHLPLSVHEFFYPLMQAYDSVAIKADIELGGTDQTFNILMGRNIQKDYGMEPQLTLFMPLLQGIDGVEKMSKSLGNYIGISEPANTIYEKVMKIPDSLIIKYYNLCTDVHPKKVEELQKMLDGDANPRDVKMMLALEITTIYAGEESAKKAEESFKSLYQKKLVPDDAPVIEVTEPTEELSHGMQLLDALIAGGFYKSRNEVRRLFAQGSAKLNDEKVMDIAQIDLSGENLVLKIGKAKYFKIKHV